MPHFIAALALIAGAWPAYAQDAPAAEGTDDIPHIVVTPALRTPGGDDRILSDDELAHALTYDPSRYAGSGKRFRAPLTPAPRATWSGGRRDNGSTHVSVTKPLAHDWNEDWNLRAGADLTVPGEQTTTYRPGGPMPGTVSGETEGGLWAAAAVPHVADVRLRVDPGLAQNRLGANIQRTVPLGKDYSVTIENKVAVTETTGLVAPPAGGAPQIGNQTGNQAGNQVWNTEQRVKFNVHTTGTSIAAGTATSTVDGVTHRTFSADQRIYGPLHVTGSVTDPGRETFSQSIGAKLKLSW